MPYLIKFTVAIICIDIHISSLTYMNSETYMILNDICYCIEIQRHRCDLESSSMIFNAFLHEQILCCASLPTYCFPYEVIYSIAHHMIAQRVEYIAVHILLKTTQCGDIISISLDRNVVVGASNVGCRSYKLILYISTNSYIQDIVVILRVCYSY